MIGKHIIMKLYFQLNFVFFVCLFGPLPSDSLLFFGSVGQRQSSGTIVPARATWIDRANELIEYRNKYGDTLVPKRYSENPALGNWVNKQRAQHRRFCVNESQCSMTKEQVRILDGIGFCWNATALSSRHRREEDTWWHRYEDLKQHGQLHSKLPQSMTTFLRQQRQEYRKYKQGESSKLDEAKVSALATLDPDWWKNSRERQWDMRCKELEEYCAEHGNCCVPINYENRKLANWVSSVRKKFKLKASGEYSTLSEEQIKQLNSQSFVWDRWDYEYELRYGRKLNS
jgi:hypothetical protein